jgi:membrane protease YdiL (CAAX protease family)
MNPDALNPLGWTLLGVIACALVALGAWYFWPGASRHLLPPQRCRAVPWSGWEVFAAFFVGILLAPAGVQAVLRGSGFFTWLYGAEFTKALKDFTPAAEAARQAAQSRSTLWVSVLSALPAVVGILALLRGLSGTEPYQLGITWHRWGRNVLAGFLAWVAFTPSVYLLLELVNWVSERALQVKPEEHALTRLAHQPLQPVEWVVLVLSAVLAAPVQEELLFRGVIQSWLARQARGGTVAVVAALVLALLSKLDEVGPALEKRDWSGAALALAPAWGFVLVLAPGALLLQRRSPAGAAVYGSALAFGAAHAAWPTPIPLFVLGVGLGLLARRMQSLVAPIMLHALFNAIACVVLLWPHLAPHPEPGNGNDATSALRRAAPASTSTAVPGSWCPRRTYARAIGPSRGDTTDEVTCPTSSPPRSTRDPAGAGPSPWSFRPTSVRLTWPRSRAMTIGSWPRKQPFV